jgi:hypothetical protein
LPEAESAMERDSGTNPTDDFYSNFSASVHNHLLASNLRRREEEIGDSVGTSIHQNMASKDLLMQLENENLSGIHQKEEPHSQVDESKSNDNDRTDHDSTMLQMQ